MPTSIGDAAAAAAAAARRAAEEAARKAAEEAARKAAEAAAEKAAEEAAQKAAQAAAAHAHVAAPAKTLPAPIRDTFQSQAVHSGRAPRPEDARLVHTALASANDAAGPIVHTGRQILMPLDEDVSARLGAALRQDAGVTSSRIDIEGNAGGQGTFHVKGHEVGFNYSGGAFYTRSTSVEPSTEPGANGNQVIHVTTQVGLKASGGFEAGKAGIDGSFAHGREVQYEASVTPKELAAIRAGKEEPPSPYHPDQLPPGTSVTITHGSFSDTDVGVKYDGIGVNSTYSVEKGQAARVAKVGPHQVEISVGPEKEIQNQTRFGVNAFGVSGSFGQSDTSKDSKVRSVRIDLSKPGGRAAYARFLHSGKVPAGDNPKAGISDSATVHELDITSQSSWEAGVGPLHIGGTSSKETYSGLDIKYADGRSAQQVFQNGGDGYSSSWIIERDKNGKVTNQTVDLTAKPGSSELADPGSWAALTGGDPGKSGLHVRVNEQQLQTYQRYAHQIEAYAKAHGERVAPTIEAVGQLKGVNDLEWAFRSNNGNRQENLAGGFALVQRWAEEHHEPLPQGVFTAG